MFMRKLSNFASSGVRQAAQKLLLEFRIQYVHRKACRRSRQYIGHGPIKLHLGCGQNIKPGWINVDLWSWKADLRLDLRERLPFVDSSATIIYAEHLFEHLEYPSETTHFLKECLRVVVPGGRLSLGVPDAELPLKSYASDDPWYFEFVRARWHPAWCDTRMHNINFHFRQGTEHKYAYDWETLEKVLVGAGFVSVCKRSFELGLDTDPQSRHIGTLYVDGIKPKTDGSTC